MKVDYLIEAEKVAGHQRRPGRVSLLKVSKSAYYERREGRPLGPARSADATLLEKIKAIHARVQGYLRCPADPRRAPPSPRGLREAPGDPVMRRPVWRDGTRIVGTGRRSPTRRPSGP